MLSKTMQEALDHANKAGRLVRLPGGFWVEGADQYRWNGGRPATWWTGTATVNALEKRGKIKWTGWKQGRNRVFPIAARPVG